MAIGAAAQQKSEFKSLGEKTQIVAVSPNGRYVVGSDPTYSSHTTYIRSFIHDTETGTTQWVTEYKEDDYTTWGAFNAVNDNGVVCGTAKDPDLLITTTDFDGSPITSPADVAAVWKDGVCTRLGYGDFDTNQFTYNEDGAAAVGISADGKTVIGNIGTGNSTFTYPCIWTETADGKWNMEMMSLPEGYKNGLAKYISTDGSTIVGSATNDNWENVVLIWKNGDCRIIKATDLGVVSEYSTTTMLMSVSPNGRYSIINANYSSYVIYDITDGTYRTLTLFNTGEQSSSMAVDNNGNVVGSIAYGSAFFGGEIYYRPYWYSYKEDRTFDLSYCMSLFAPGMETPFTMSYEEKTQAFPMAISGDGNIIAGNSNTYVALGQTPESWYMRLNINADGIPATPSGVAGLSESLHEVKLTWNKDENVYDGFKLKSYNIYRDNKLTATLPADAEKMELIQKDVPGGHPVYTVEGVYERTDGTMLYSPKSNGVTVSVPDTYSLPLVEDFESNSLLTNYWELVPDYGGDTDIAWGPLQYAGIPGSAAVTYSDSGKPYSVSLVTRPLDATKLSSVKLSFAIIVGFVNIDGQPLDKDTLSVEITTDGGKTWKEEKSWTMEDFDALENWSLRSVDLSEDAAGKLFKLRLRKHGQGTTLYYFQIDNLSIAAGGEQPAPTGLIGMMPESSKSVSLAWQNPSGAYCLNYITDLALMKYFVGNEGKDMIAANSFGQDELKMYDGKFLTGVTTILYKQDYGNEVLGIHASVVVYENGQLVYEQEIKDPVFNGYFTVPLDEPLKIDASKELKIGLKIYDYDAEQMPISYIVSKKFVAGKSDLYSEDGGMTWLKLSDFYAEQGNPEQGYCCWDITGCVTDDPELVLADTAEPYAYNVLRNGEQVNTLMLDKMQTRFTDPEGQAGDRYEVVAYYLDGTSSEPSEAFIASLPSGIDNTTADGIRAEYIPGNGYIGITGEYDSAELISISGVTVAHAQGGVMNIGNITPGVYLLKIEAAGKVTVKKLYICR